MYGNLDPLTGLANAALFESRLEIARARMSRKPRSFAVLYIDIDRFSAVNEALGFAGGEGLLAQFAQRLKSFCRAGDTLARLAGDDFALLAEGLPDSAAGEALAMEIIDLLTIPFLSGPGLLYLQASIGIAGCAAGQAFDGKTLMTQANAAMHDAKRVSGNCYRTFSGLLRKLALESAEDEEWIGAA